MPRQWEEEPINDRIAVVPEMAAAEVPKTRTEKKDLAEEKVDSDEEVKTVSTAAAAGAT